MSTRPILIMAGGTGGHVFPALALARLLQRHSCVVLWLGTRRGLEARLVPAEHIAIEWITVAGVRGKGLMSLLAAPFRVALAVTQALKVIWRHRPLAVVGLGGFVSGPGGVAAWLSRRPLIIHEQNAVAGFTNRVLAHLAREVLEAFPGSFGPGVRARAIGNPVRAEIIATAPPAARFGARAGAIHLLVIGGSQGAARLNAVLPQALAQLGGSVSLEVRHQAGPRWLEAAERAYAEAGVRAAVSAFIDDMAAAYAWADLVICRAGALTVSELAAAGVGAILVPFAAAVDDHQTANARYLVSAGAAVLIAERELTAERLAAELRRLCADRATLLAMAERARALARPQATEALADTCMRYAEDAA
jgi:UDP-N-acetylglucosamine--N-acetylmuramyl-(pentapeptide) pyrophosphoryl-undecaprenol N-acetylglucosamine transferase